jgi:hypothetical protein
MGNERPIKIGERRGHNGEAMKNKIMPWAICYFGKRYGLVVIVVSSLFVCASCGKNDTPKANHALYLQTISRIKSGEIKTDEERGIKTSIDEVRLPQSAVLPSDLSAASVDGEVYIFRPFHDQLLVVFKTWRGKGFNMEGYLYAAAPLRPQDTTNDVYGNKIIALGPIDLVLEKQIETNWYQVNYDLD